MKVEFQGDTVRVTVGETTHIVGKRDFRLLAGAAKWSLRCLAAGCNPDEHQRKERQAELKKQREGFAAEIRELRLNRGEMI